MAQNVTSTTTKGLTIGLILVVLGLVIYFLKIDFNGPIKWVGYVVFIGGIIWSVNSYGKQINYNSTFGNYFAHGFKVSALVTAILIIYIVIFNVLFPDFKEMAMEQSRKAMIEKNIPQEQMQKALDITEKFFMVFIVGGTLVVYLIVGAVSSVVGAAITKKEPDNFVDDSNQTNQ
jgi:phosphoglycerol transferase MdoB-like AlkP superfamily enzyme